jgi:hypothetical protein
MWGNIEGRDKIAIARRALADLVEQLPDQLEVGLGIYGHRKRDDCGDVEIAVPPALGSGEAVARKVKAVKPRGVAPIAGALEAAAEALRETVQPASIVLISDGAETCERDPCAAVEAIRREDANVRVHVVGFDVKEEERPQLQCIAEAGGGKYFAAADSAELAAALADVQKVVTEPPPVAPVGEAPAPAEKKTVKLLPGMGRVVTVNGLGNVHLLDPQSKETKETIFADGASQEVPAGTYAVRYGPKFEVAEIEVKAEADVTLDAHRWLATVSTRNGLGNVYLVDPQSGEEVTAIVANGASRQVPPGTYLVRYGAKFVIGSVELQAGQSQTLDAHRWLGKVTAPKIGGELLYLVGPDDRIAAIAGEGEMVQVPAGTYKVRLGKTEAGTIDVAAGQELVIE